MEGYCGKVCAARFASGNLSENLEKVCESKLPLIVHVWNFSKPQHKDIARKIYSDDVLLDLFNSQYLSYGIDVENYELEPFLNTFINLEADSPGFKVFRVNILD